MANEKNSIPVLTEVYRGAQTPPVLSPAFFEYAMVQLKPYMDKALAESLEAAKQNFLMEMNSRIDKTKADLATEIPQMYQLRAEIFQADLDRQLMRIQETAIAAMQNFADSTQRNFEVALKGEVPELEALMKQRIHEAFTAELPNMRQEISARVNGEIEALIHSVRLVMPKRDDSQA
jgi:hypothetical protein